MTLQTRNKHASQCLQGCAGFAEENGEILKTLLDGSEDRCSIQLSYGRDVNLIQTEALFA